MKTSISTFVLGAIAGISGTILIISTSSTSNPIDSATQLTIEQRLDKIDKAVANLNTTSTELHSLVEKYSYMIPKSLSTQVQSIRQTQTSSDKADSTGNKLTDKSYQQFLTQFEQNQDSMMTPAGTQAEQVNEQPTQDQIKHFHSIETKLFSAANNHTANLSSLVTDAASLTREQRNTLTQKAFGMIQSGALSPDQFKP